MSEDLNDKTPPPEPITDISKIPWEVSTHEMTGSILRQWRTSCHIVNLTDFRIYDGMGGEDGGKRVPLIAPGGWDNLELVVMLEYDLQSCSTRSLRASGARHRRWQTGRRGSSRQARRPGSQPVVPKRET